MLQRYFILTGLALIILVFALGCNQVNLWDDAIVKYDTLPPGIRWVWPRSGESNVPPNVSIDVGFLDRVDINTINSSTIIISNDAGNIFNFSVSQEWDNVHIYPQNLQRLTRYYVYISDQIKDPAGNKLIGAYLMWFVTADTPQIWPDIYDGYQLLASQPLRFRFSEPMDTNGDWQVTTRIGSTNRVYTKSSSGITWRYNNSELEIQHDLPYSLLEPDPQYNVQVTIGGFRSVFDGLECVYSDTNFSIQMRRTWTSTTNNMNSGVFVPGSVQDAPLVLLNHYNQMYMAYIGTGNQVWAYGRDVDWEETDGWYQVGNILTDVGPYPIDIAMTSSGLVLGHRSATNNTCRVRRFDDETYLRLGGTNINVSQGPVYQVQLESDYNSQLLGSYIQTVSNNGVYLGKWTGSDWEGVNMLPPKMVHRLKAASYDQFYMAVASNSSAAGFEVIYYDGATTNSIGGRSVTDLDNIQLELLNGDPMVFVHRLGANQIEVYRYSSTWEDHSTLSVTTGSSNFSVSVRDQEIYLAYVAAPGNEVYIARYDGSSWRTGETISQVSKANGSHPQIVCTWSRLYVAYVDTAQRPIIRQHRFY